MNRGVAAFSTRGYEERRLKHGQLHQDGSQQQRRDTRTMRWLRGRS